MLVKPIKHMAEMIHTGFMTAIYEVCVERPGEVCDSSKMEAREPDGTQLKTEQVVICTTELGLHRVSGPLPPVDSSKGSQDTSLKS